MSGYSLMIAEKPSVAFEVTKIMAVKRGMPDKSGPTPVHTFECAIEGFEGQEVKFTAVAGHLFEFILPEEYDNWKLDPKVLFTCPLKRKTIKPELNEHIKSLAMGAKDVVFWMDNDREGEAICFEAMDIITEGFAEAGKTMSADFFKRALISAITKEDVTAAMQNLHKPNSQINDASLARQEVDLRVGFAFTRLLTKSLKYLSTDLFGKVVSFGPCQTPALALCVDGEGSTMSLNVQQPDGKEVAFECVPTNPSTKSTQLVKGISDAAISSGGKLNIVSRKVDEMYVDPPTALNTVSYIKYASSEFGIPPNEAMEVAEKLYLKGLISYPRTETSSYPDNVDYKKILENLGEVFELDDQIDDLLDNVERKVKQANERDGAANAGDHTPILPVTTRPNFKEEAEKVTGVEKDLFFLVVRIFLASIGHKAKVSKETCVINYGGNEYQMTGNHMKHRGFTKFFNTIPRTNQSFDMLAKSIVKSITVKGTKESVLIDLMDKKGIGTDATIATHINTLYARELCKINEEREITPSKKGQCIIGALEKSVPALVDTGLRKNMEEQFVSIEKGLPKNVVLKKCLDDYLSTYETLEKNMELTKQFVKAYIAEHGTK